jgi:hypothetical protein
MATVARSVFALAAVVVIGCGKPVGLGGKVTPLVQIQVQTVGDLPMVPGLDGQPRAPNLRVALVWGLQWMPEPFCFLPPESPEAATVIAVGCRDTFGFVPDVVGADVPVEHGVATTIALINLPAADVMVGDVTARIAYASLIAYDDRNSDGILDLGRPQRQASSGDNADSFVNTGDVVLGASFSSMTQPDQRIAYIEGDYAKLSGVAFYPRPGCPDPPPPVDGFWVFSAGGLSRSSLLASLVPGSTLPTEPSCGVASLADALVSIALQNPAAGALPILLDASATDSPDASVTGDVDAEPSSPLDAGPSSGPDLSQLACTTNDSGGVTSYRGPLGSRRGQSTPLPNLKDPNLVWACANFPRLPGDTGDPPAGQQLVMAWRNRTCRTTLHYTLRGCRRDPACATTEWDNTADPRALSWWPCKLPQ